MLGLSRELRRLALGLLLILPVACKVHPPATEPSEESVYKAAEEVITLRYPHSGAFRKAGALVAMTPETLEGSYKSKKKISVLVRRTYIGGYEPVVRVTKYIEVGSPPLRDNPEALADALHITEVQPFAVNEWQPLDHMPYEEQEIYDQILQRIGPRG